MNFAEEVVKFAHLIENKGFINAMEGNISTYDRETDTIYITPSGKCKCLLDESGIAVLDKDRNQVGGDFKASSEYRLHEAAYKARKDVGGVIHCHAPYLTAFAICGKPVRMDSCPEFLLAYKEIPVLPFGMTGTHDIHKGLDEALMKGNVVLLANHGVIAVGSDLEQALRFVEGAEGIAKILTIIDKVGTPQDLPKEAFDYCWNFGKDYIKNLQK